MSKTIGGRYELEQPLGGGAMSSVWLAHDAELERKVAVKLLAHDADRARFEREAHAVAALAHPNICQLYDYGESGEGPYMILEHLPGGTLEDLLARGRPLPDEDAMRIAQEVAAGLAHAHGRGLVHRDLKPANILFDGEGRAKIADFGIARIEGGHELTVAGTVLGTAAYISPEQAAGQPATPASDVYSFGVILFRMLTGRTPFVSDSAIDLVRKHQQEEPPAAAELRPDAPPTLAAVAAAALAKDPARRPRDGDALKDWLTGSADETMLLAPAAPPTQVLPAAAAATQVVAPQRAPRRRRAVPVALLAAALALAVAGIAAAVLLTGGDETPAAPPTGTLDLPSVVRQTTADTAATTTAPTEPETTTSTPTVTTPVTTAPATTVAPPTTAPAPAPTVPATTAPPVTTTAPPVTTAPATTTTAPTDTTPTTVDAAPAAFVPPGQAKKDAAAAP